ncbi:aldo/keto reductase [Flavobacteriaceae bacterium]|nr:aldo/keto reductase [Flavobacteriaceae bacterium]
MKSMDTFSKIIAGTMTWGAWGKNYTTSEMSNLIEDSLELGISTFDHADIYGGYTTEADFGEAFNQSNVDRSKVQFITKCGIQYPSEQRPLEVKHYDYSAEHIIWSTEKSLQNLKTDYIDVLLLHRPSPLMDPKEIAKAFDHLKSQGKVKSFGVSNFTASQMSLLSSENLIEWNQIECSLTQSNLMFDDTLNYMSINQIGAMAWSPLGSYFKEDNNQNKRIKPLLSKMCSTYNASEDQILLAWLLHHPANIHPIVGTTQKERLKDAVDALSIKLKIQDWFLLLEASWGHKVP